MPEWMNIMAPTESMMMSYRDEKMKVWGMTNMVVPHFFN